MSLRSTILTRSQLSPKGIKHNEESGELTKDREESKVNTTREEHTINTVRVEPTVNTAYQHNAFGEENYGGKIEGDSEEKNDGCIQENSETAMDHSTYNPYLEAHETATQYSYSFDHRYTIMRENIDSSDPNKRLEGLVKLRRRTCTILGKDDDDADFAVLHDFLPALAKCLVEEDQSETQLEASWIMANISSGTLADMNAVIDTGAMPILVQLLFSPIEEIQEEALIALGCIAGENARLRDYVNSLGALESVLQLLQGNYSKLVLRRAYWILQNFLRTKDPPLPSALVQKILPVVCQLLDNDDAKDLIDAVGAFIWLTETGIERLQMVLDYPNAVHRLVQCLEHKSERIQNMSARAIKNILRGTEEQLSTVRQCLGESTYNKLLKMIEKYKEN